MKKTLLASAVLLAAAAPALAQSSVTIYGVVDLGARSVKNDGYSTDNMIAKDGSGTSSRLGFKGTEDLGGGLKASFVLESALSANTGVAGSGSRFWDRQATLSLSSASWGEVRLGRAKTSNRLVIDAFDPWGAAGMPDVTRIYSALTSAAVTNRTDNQIAYFTPTMGGFYGSIDASEGSSNGNKTYSGRLGYKTGALHVAGGYGESENTNGQKYKLGTLGASYDFGFVTPSLSVSQSKYMGYEQTVYQIGATAPLAGGTLRASYAQSTVNTAAEAFTGDGQLFAIGYLYPLSKRTALYGTAAFIKNDGLATYRLGGTGINAGGDSTGFDVGIRHSF